MTTTARATHLRRLEIAESNAAWLANLSDPSTLDDARLEVRLGFLAFKDCTETPAYKAARAEADRRHLARSAKTAAALKVSR